MANQYAVDHKKRHVSLPAKLTDVASQGGRMRILYDTYTTSSTTNGDIIYFGKLPGGAKVWEAAIHVVAALGSSTTFKLGTTEDDDAFLAAGTANTANATRFMIGATASSAPVLTPKSVTAEASVIATLGGADAADGKEVQVRIIYSID